MRQRRKTKQKPNSQSQRVRDIVVGFLGWIILDNLYLLLGLSLGYFIAFAQAAGFFLPLLSPLLVISLMLLWKRQTWIGVGVLIALLVNSGVWAILYGLHLGQLYYYLLCPFPIGTRLII
jgi:hypothetical protein